MKKALFLSSIRLFKKHFTRFLTIFAVALVAVAFTSGLGEVEEQIKHANTNAYNNYTLSDLYLKSKRVSGFTADEMAYLIDKFGEENVLSTFCFEIKNDDKIYRLYVYDLEKQDMNTLTIRSGSFPNAENEILVERATHSLSGMNVGDTLHFSMLGFSADLVVSGVVLSPQLLYNMDNVSYQYDEESLDYVLYADYATVSHLVGYDFTMVNDVYITLDEDARKTFDAFSDRYEKTIKDLKEEIETEFGEDNVSALSLFENMGMFSMISYAEKIGVISIIFVVFFLAVTLLVVYSAMNRLFAEERQQIACQKTLGYSDFSILGKYLLFDFLGTMAGGAVAYGVGLTLTKLIYNAFHIQYAMPPYPADGGANYYLICLATVVLGTMLLTLLTGLNTTRQKPVVLLTPKAPKAGRKVIVEKIPAIWNHLSFKHKSTVRNVLLFRSRFYMTVVSVVGSAVLVFAGLGLVDNTTTIPEGETLVTISIFLVVFSALLCALVIYNLTNINVSERCREIATLMVLGYSDEEVLGYVYREIYVMCGIAALLGLPFGAGFVHFVFEWVGFGALANVHWWSYLITPFATMAFCFLSTRLLKWKILKTDMNASLKTLE